MATRDIGIFKIAHTVVDRDEVQRWLDYIGANEFEIPDTEIVSNPALLIALAGKRCYMSFQKSLNPNLTRIRKDYVEYFENILASGHGCYDAETDVLTSQGWVNWPDVTPDMLLATRAANGRIEYQKPEKLLIGQQYRGRMYRVAGCGVDLLVTPNHNMYVVPTTTHRGRQKRDEDYTLISAEQLGHRSHAYVKSGTWVCESQSAAHPLWSTHADVLALFGFGVGDGYLAPGTNRLQFHLRRERKIAWLQQLVARLGWTLHESEIADKYNVQIPDAYVQLFHQMYDTNREKQLPAELLMHNSATALLALYDGLLQSDGSTCGTAVAFDTTSPNLPGQFQHLCLHIGLAANYGESRSRENSYGDKPLTRLYVARRTLRPAVNKFVDSAGKTSWVEDWEGLVYCAQVPNRTLYVRRGGKPVWCGNSVLEHAVYSFAIENVSRVFTGEMNRHRAGWAISEGSMRFIRFDGDIDYWLPTSIAPNDTDDEDLAERKRRSRAVFERVFANTATEYRELLDIWNMDDTHKNFSEKKKVTSCLRRIVPMGVATGGVWTGNVRALRHVMAMRCAPVAEEEILHVFSRIVKLMRDHEPRLFGDFIQDENGFWVPEYWKV